MMANHVTGAARRRRERRLRAWHRHVQTAAATEQATALHHCAQRPRTRVVGGPEQFVENRGLDEASEKCGFVGERAAVNEYVAPAPVAGSSSTARVLPCESTSCCGGA